MKKLLFVVLAWFAFAGAAFAAVNVNTASKEELMSLKGIGEVKAQAIIDYRTKNGPFKSLEEVDKVPGIGLGTIAKIKSDVALTGKTTVPAAAARKAAADKAGKKDVKTEERLMSKADKTKVDSKANGKTDADKKARAEENKKGLAEKKADDKKDVKK